MGGSLIEGLVNLLAAIVAAGAIFALSGYVLSLVWNALIPGTFGGPFLTWGKAMLMLFISILLLGRARITVKD